MLTIFIADSSARNVEIVCNVLGQEFRIVSVGNATGLVATVRAHRPALILLGCVDAPALDACRALRAAPEAGSAPVLALLSGDATREDETAVLEAGAADYLVAPLLPAALRSRVRAQLALARQRQAQTAEQDMIGMLLRLSVLRDREGPQHPWRMAAYAAALAEAAGWSAADCEQLRLAATLHDVGKIGLPQRVLHQAFNHEPEEWELMKSHCRVGHEILSQSSQPLFQMAATIALTHHEKWDGHGYPDGLSGEAIPEAGRIAAIADAFDVQSSMLVIQDWRSLNICFYALEMTAGTDFDPRLVALFRSIMPRILELRSQWSGRPDGRN